jgi:hypothetical protein
MEEFGEKGMGMFLVVREDNHQLLMKGVAIAGLDFSNNVGKGKQNIFGKRFYYMVYFG